MSQPHTALARKYRPGRFDEVIGQRGVVETLRNAIATGRLAQSFIFAGPRGVGKTTTARLLARALNCVNGPTIDPCGTCDACVEIARGQDIDVLEIDGATYTGVDAVREVIVEPLSIAPMRDRFKIFIIDEVHRLSKQAFDALLKSIEEPPPYVKFMMATTDPQSVPDTIKSRSQVFELKALPFASIREQLRNLAAQEGVSIDDASLALVARHAEGSMRDALSALDQVLAFTADAVTADDVSTVLGLIGRDVQFDIAETVAAEDLAGAFSHAAAVVESGVDLRLVCRELARLVRDLLVLQIDPSRVGDPEIASEGEGPRLTALAARYSREDLMRAFDLLSRAEYDVRTSSQPRHTFEMALVKWIHLRQLTPLTDLIAGLEQGRPMPSSAAPRGGTPVPPRGGSARPGGSAEALRAGVAAAQTRSTAHPSSTGRVSDPATRPAATSQPARQPPPAGAPVGDLKAALVSAIREQNKVFYGMVIGQAHDITVDGNKLVFTFAAVHRSLMPQLEARRAWIEQIARNVAGRPFSVVVRELPPVEAAVEADQPDDARAGLMARAKAEPVVQVMLDVFGGEIERIEEIE